MENSIKISIIMPVYKVEDYVERAIKTIKNQTLTQWEFIIVDDGSPDNSGKICDSFAKADSRIKVIHQKNAGAPAARNNAMDIARGEYYYFMDGDDWAESTMLEDMYNIAQKNNSQLVISGFYIDTYYDENNYYEEIKQVKSKLFKSQRDFRTNAYKLFDKNQLYSPWNKLYQRKYIEDNNIRFPKTFWDDFPFVMEVIKNIEKVCVTSKSYYHFIRQRKESETAAYRYNMYEKREDENKLMEDLYSYWNLSNDEKSKEMIARRYVERFIGCVENLTNPNCELSHKDKINKLKEMINNNNLRKYLGIMKPGSKYMSLLVIPLKIKSTHLVLLEGKVISYVKRKNVKTFAKLKANR